MDWQQNLPVYLRWCEYELPCAHKWLKILWRKAATKGKVSSIWLAVCNVFNLRNCDSLGCEQRYRICCSKLGEQTLEVGAEPWIAQSLQHYGGRNEYSSLIFFQGKSICIFQATGRAFTNPCREVWKDCWVWKPFFQKGQKVKIPDAYQVKNLPKINWWRVSKRSLWTSVEDTECFLEGRVVPPSLWRWWKDSPETADENPGTKQQEPAERNSEPAAKPQQWWRKLSADYRRLCQVCCYLEATGLTGPKPGSKVWFLFEIPPKYNVKTHLLQSCA